MNKTLRYGNRGSEVATLQEGLNKLPSNLARLVVDGIYGAKTVGRVKEFQRANFLSVDGITGPITWELFFKLLSKINSGPPPQNRYERLRGNIIRVAKRFVGAVDFDRIVNGRPHGIDFIKLMFMTTVFPPIPLSDDQFKYPSNYKEPAKRGLWSQEPFVNGKPTSWCGIFCVYCYQMAGFTEVKWRLGQGPTIPLRRVPWYPNFGSRIRSGDIGAVATKQHHFLISEVKPGGLIVSIDGNGTRGRIEEKGSHRIGVDNFNYYTLPS